MYSWDEEKRERVFSKRGVDLAWIEQVCSLPYVEDQKSDDPEQYRIVGKYREIYITYIVEYTEDDLGELVWVVTGWNSTQEEIDNYEREIFGS